MYTASRKISLSATDLLLNLSLFKAIQAYSSQKFFFAPERAINHQLSTINHPLTDARH